MFKRNDVWWTCFRYKEIKIQKSLKKADEELAKELEQELKKAMRLLIDADAVKKKHIVEVKNKHEDEKPVGHDKTFKDMMDEFMKEHAPTVSISMQRSYASSLKHLSPFFKNKRLLSISRSCISGYKKLRRGQGAKPATINRELAMFSKAFNLAVEEWEWIKDSDKPFSKISYLEEKNERYRWLAEDEEVELLESCPGWLREIIVFALNTGLRQDELLSLEWSRVDLARKTAFIQKTKNGKPKTIPLNQIVIDVLEQKLNGKVRHLKNGFVFLSNHGTKIDRHNLRRAFDKAKEKVGIKDFRFHDLRHTFATRLSQSGIDQYRISKLLGHEDARMTQRYSHHCAESLRSGVEILEVR
jgi:integrase|tara:strand:+ start:457 stop:1527 length:1071 start_codon:yes stop_codon:yes gene_type:complete